MSLSCQDCGTTIYRQAYRGSLPQYCSKCKHKRYNKYHAAKLKRYRRNLAKKGNGKNGAINRSS